MIIKQILRRVLSITAATPATTSSTTTKFNNDILASLFSSTSSSSSLLLKRTLITCVGLQIPTPSLRSAPVDALLAAPSWAFCQRHGSKVLGSEVRPKNIVQRKDRVYQVMKAQHSQHGRGGASIQVELRDVDSGNKVTERFRTDETIEIQKHLTR